MEVSIVTDQGAVSVRVGYTDTSQMIYVGLSTRKPKNTLELLEGQVFGDLDAKGRLVGIEILTVK